MSRCHYVFIFLDFFVHKMTQLAMLISFVDSLKEHVPPCVVLVINDNPYGLMFALSYICRSCP